MPLKVMKNLEWVCHKANLDSCELDCRHDSELHSFLLSFLKESFFVISLTGA